MSNNNTPNTETTSMQQQVGNGNPDGQLIGAASTSKVALHGKTPVVMRSGAAQVAVTTTAATSTTPYGYATKAQAEAIVTLVNEIRDTLVEKGIFKGSA